MGANARAPKAHHECIGKIDGIEHGAEEADDEEGTQTAVATFDEHGKGLTGTKFYKKGTW